MTHHELLSLLLSEDVYQRIKQNEEEIFSLIPELKVCKGFDQRNSWHKYDVYEHILHVVAGVDAKLPLRLVALFHDVGKPLAFTQDAEGVGHFFGHWDRSLEIFQKYVPRFGLTQAECDLMTVLIYYHDINVDRMGQGDVTQMVKRIGRENMALLFAIKRADLLAQADRYHGLLPNIQKQEERIQTICNAKQAHQ